MRAELLFIEESHIVMRDVPAQFCLLVSMGLESLHKLLLFSELPGALVELGQPSQPLPVQLVDLLLVVAHQFLLLAHSV